MMNNNTGARTAPTRQTAAPAPRRPGSSAPQPIRRPSTPAPQRRPQSSGLLSGVLGWFSQADHRYTAAKVALIILLVVYVHLVLGANTAKDVPFDWIALRVSADSSLSTLQQGDANTFRERFGMDPDGCEGWLLYASDDLMDVSELLIVKAADAGVRERIEAAASARLDTQKESFRNYGTNQYELLQHAILWQRGSYLFYGVSDSIERWEDTFLACIK